MRMRSHLTVLMRPRVSPIVLSSLLTGTERVANIEDRMGAMPFTENAL